MNECKEDIYLKFSIRSRYYGGERVSIKHGASWAKLPVWML